MLHPITIPRGPIEHSTNRRLSRGDSLRLWELAPNPVDLLVIEGAGHYEMYDEPENVDTAVARLADFYADNL